MKTIKLSGFALVMALSIGFFASCSSSDPEPTPLPPIGGYASADEVGKADLIAYFPLNGDGKEVKSSTAPSSAVGVTWVAGAKGQAASLNAGYLYYPVIASLPSTLSAYTMSAWVKVKNNFTPASASASIFFTLSRPNEWEGNLNLFAETGQKPAVEENGTVNDSIIFKNTFRSTVSGGQGYENLLHLEPWMKADNLVTPNKHVANPVAVGGTWAHVVGTWDGATNIFTIYVNGKKSSNPAFEKRGDNTSIVFDTPTHAVLGAFGDIKTTTEPWNKPMTGLLDEVRVWKKALNAADINALYELEKAGR